MVTPGFFETTGQSPILPVACVTLFVMLTAAIVACLPAARAASVQPTESRRGE